MLANFIIIYIYIYIQPVAIETSGATGPETGNFLRELGKCIKKASRETRSLGYLLQRISVAIQIGNATLVLGTLPAGDSDYVSSHACIIYIII